MKNSYLIILVCFHFDVREFFRADFSCYEHTRSSNRTKQHITFIKHTFNPL
jgi:hypothetical protein